MDENTDENGYLIIEEAAKYLKTTKDVMYWLNRHGLRYSKVGRQCRYRREWIDEFMQKNSIKNPCR